MQAAYRNGDQRSVRAIPELIRLLNEDNETGVRSIAIFALRSVANRNDAAVVAALTAATKDKDAVVRTEAVQVLPLLAPAPAAEAGMK